MFNFLRIKYCVHTSGMPALNFINSLNINGIDISKINIDTSTDFSALSGTFIGSDANFVNLFEPTATLLENNGYGHIVASVGELGIEVPYTAFYAKNSYINNNEELLIKFTNVIDKSLEYVRNTDSTTIAKQIITQFPDENITNIAIMIDRYKDIDAWNTTPYISEEVFNNLENFLIKYELIDNKTSYTNIVRNLYE